jgi:hypothetical protein
MMVVPLPDSIVVGGSDSAEPLSPFGDDHHLLQGLL